MKRRNMTKKELKAAFDEAKAHGMTKLMDEYNKRWIGLFMDYKEKETRYSD